MRLTFAIPAIFLIAGCAQNTLNTGLSPEALSNLAGERFVTLSEPPPEMKREIPQVRAGSGAGGLLGAAISAAAAVTISLAERGATQIEKMPDPTLDLEPGLQAAVAAAFAERTGAAPAGVVEDPGRTVLPTEAGPAALKRLKIDPEVRYALNVRNGGMRLRGTGSLTRETYFFIIGFEAALFDLQSGALAARSLCTQQIDLRTFETFKFNAAEFAGRDVTEARVALDAHKAAKVAENQSGREGGPAVEPPPNPLDTLTTKAEDEAYLNHRIKDLGAACADELVAKLLTPET